MIAAPNPIDIHVGGQLKLRRILAGLSHEELSARLKLSAQQIQRFENGLDRVGAERLFAIARVLDVPVQYFFEETTARAAGVT